MCIALTFHKLHALQVIHVKYHALVSHNFALMAKHGWKNKIHISVLMVNNPGPAETQICPAFANSADLKKPTDLDLHCLSLSM